MENLILELLGRLDPELDSDLISQLQSKLTEIRIAVKPILTDRNISSAELGIRRTLNSYFNHQLNDHAKFRKLLYIINSNGCEECRFAIEVKGRYDDDDDDDYKDCDDTQRCKRCTSRVNKLNELMYAYYDRAEEASLEAIINNPDIVELKAMINLAVQKLSYFKFKNQYYETSEH